MTKNFSDFSLIEFLFKDSIKIETFDYILYIYIISELCICCYTKNNQSMLNILAKKNQSTCYVLSAIYNINFQEWHSTI